MIDFLRSIAEDKNFDTDKTQGRNTYIRILAYMALMLLDISKELKKQTETLKKVNKK